MKLNKKNQQWKKWFRKKITRHRVVFTWTETYSKPVTEFFREWINYMRPPKGQPLVLVNGEQAYDIPEEWKGFVNEQAALSTLDNPIFRLTLVMPPKKLGGKYPIRKPAERRLGSNSTPARIEARQKRDYDRILKTHPVIEDDD